MKQHFTKVFLASLLLAVAPFASAIVVAEDAIPDSIQSLLPSDGGSDIASQEAEFLSEFSDDDDSGVALSNADVNVVIMSNEGGDASVTTSASDDSASSNNAGGSAGGSSVSNGIQVAALDGIPQDILDLLNEIFGDGSDGSDGSDGGDDGDGGDGGDGGVSTDAGNANVGTLITDELVEAYDNVVFSADNYDRNGNGPALATTITQDSLASLSLTEIRQQGALVYTTPFRHADGHGDGPGINEDDPNTPDLGPTGRPTLQGNGTWLRMNGLDTQTCLECHGVINNSVVPAVLGVGGQGGISASPFFRAANADIDDSSRNSLDGLGIAAFDGRAINPPKNLGMGGVELGGQEITRRLQRISTLASRLAQRADRRVRLPLVAKGVDFGDIVAKSNGDLDTSGVEGVDGDLVIRPFGRKGEFDTIRSFDDGAMAFHIGMQNTDAFGPGDPDGDGIEDELTQGEMSALHVFLTTAERPFQQELDDQSQRGKRIFNRIGCSDCHKPNVNTGSAVLEYTLPEEDEPYYSVDLSSDVASGAQFETNSSGGLKLPIFSDYKRHNMGTRLAETAFFLETPDCDNEVAGTEITNCSFITMKLWGLADTGPYLHDGRALSVFEAIAFHGGEAQRVRDRFLGLSKGGQNALLAYLGTLKNPVNPNQDVLNQVQLGPN